MRRCHRRVLWTGALLFLGVFGFGFGCVGSPGTSPGSEGDGSSGRVSDSVRTHPLDSLHTAEIGIGGVTFRVWLALTPTEIQEGLMHVPAAEIPDDGGMLFVFPDEQPRSFWMLNTIAPLDIAFARADGTIVTIWQMPPQTLQSFPSIEPAMFALETKQGTFERLGIKEGDVIGIPAEVFKLLP